MLAGQSTIGNVGDIKVEDTIAKTRKPSTNNVTEDTKTNKTIIILRIFLSFLLSWQRFLSGHLWAGVDSEAVRDIPYCSTNGFLNASILQIDQSHHTARNARNESQIGFQISTSPAQATGFYAHQWYIWPVPGTSHTSHVVRMLTHIHFLTLS